MKEPIKILQEYWKYSAFRPLQEDIIQSVLAGNDTLALLPTGGGKSVCFQIPALCQEGICIVVSPLIALMKDQVYQLQKRNIAAVAVYSGMHYRDIDRILDNCAYGNTKFLYLSPERLRTDIVRERIKKMNVNLIAVDEAHCISQWGYDFRPSYLQIAEIRTLIPNIPILALTATATQVVTQDIQEKLEFKQPNIFQKSFARENLTYVVLREEGKQNKLLHILQKVAGSGVVYVRNRRKTKEIAQYLRQKGISADFYHAGLLPDERSVKQDAWISNKTRIMVSTNAFGMGIDKPDVRVVVHIDLPDSLEAYFQEAGRGGRDGKRAYAVLLYNPADKKRLEKNFEQSFPPMDLVRQVYRALGSHFQLAVGGGEGMCYDFDIITFSKKFNFNIVETFSCLKILEQAAWITLTEPVFVPSKIQITVSKDQLYDYQMRNRRFDPILKAILRTYQGAFQHLTSIREPQLASALKTTPKVLIQAFEKMQQEGIIEYIPQKDQPQIIFLHDRVNTENLTIDQARYNFRKKAQYERIQKSIAYAEAEECRSQLLLNYFDELNPPRCGQCDTCLERNKWQSTSREFKTYKTKIEQLVCKEDLTLTALIASFTPKRQQQVLKVIEVLMEEQLLIKDGELMHWKE